jgi:parallel beta-helix repeat protein
MRTKSAVWMVLMAIALGSVFAVGQTNPSGGPDNVPYFSDAFGVPKGCFILNEPIYVSYFDTTNNYNKHVSAVDTMYVSIDSQSTENIAGAAWAADAVSGTMTDGPDVGTVPGDTPTDTHTLAGAGPNAAILVLVELGLNSGQFIGDVGTTPVTVLGGDMVTVGLTTNDQDKAYVQAQLLGWWDSVTTPDPGNAGSYGALDDIVVKLTAHAANSWGNASGDLYYRINGGTWQNGGVWTDVTGALGGAYPDRYLEITAPGTVIGDQVDVYWHPGLTPPAGCSSTAMLSTAIVNQPVDVANNTYTTITVAPDNGSIGFVRDYMTIHAANAAVAGNNWTIGVHGAPAVPAYDYTFDTFPINIGTWNHLTIIGGSQPIVVIDNGSGLGFDIQAGGHFTTIDNLDIRSHTAATTRLIQLTNGPQDVTIKNCTFSTVGNASMGINVGAAGSTRLTIDNNVWRAMDSGDGAIWTEGPNPNITVTNNTFNGGGTASGYCIQGLGWTNGLIDNNTINNTAAGGILLLADNGGAPSAQASTNVTITRNTITNSANGIRFYSSGTYGPIVTSVTIEGNVLTGNTNAIRVSDGGAALDTANFTVRYNHIVGNTTGINDTDAGGVLNAELNWWGSTTGPTDAAANANGAGDPSTANVDYRPWLNGAPFAGVGVTLADNTNAAVQGNKTVESSSWYWTINQALAATHALGCGTGNHCRAVSVTTGNGTYAEEIDLTAYANIGTAVIQSLNGAGATNIEAGANASIIMTDALQSLVIGDPAVLGRGFTIYFDAAAVPTPTADKILHQGGNLEVYDCTILATLTSGIHVNGASASGSIERNVIDNCDEAGIWLENVGAGFTVDNNTITNGGDGIRIADGPNTITNNTIQFNARGIYIGPSANGNAIGGSGNTILNNAGNGLEIDSNSNTVTGNTIHANGDRGILITGDTNVFNGNTITSNAAQGVRLTAAARGNVFNLAKNTAGTNCIFDNDSDGSCNHEQMQNQNTGENVNATHNYWGSAAGPFHAMRNASGDMNNRVSDFVLIDPWAITCAGGLADATITLACGAGWYLTSIPLVPADPIAEHVYDELPVFGAYKWNPGTGVYDDLTGQNINWSDGYWLWLMGDETVTVAGAAVTTDQTFQLGAAGWQQFSVPAVDIPVTGPDENGRNDPDIEFSADGITWYTYAGAVINGLILDGIFRYDTCGSCCPGASSGQYAPAMSADAVLDPWLGYWIQTLVPNVRVRVPVAYWIANPWTQPLNFHPMSVDTQGRTPPAPPAVPQSIKAAVDEATGLVVYNEPNPIRDVNTTTFRVKGAAEIEAIRVQIFDQAGKLVFEEEQPGDELVWHADNTHGEYLANGIYLYRVSVKLDGTWVVTEVRKLAIYR